MNIGSSPANERGELINKVLQNFWLGYSQRCHFFVEKLLKMEFLGGTARLIITFYAALNSFRGLRNKNNIGSQYAKMKSMIQDAISAMKSAAELSSHTYTNKVHMLEAGLYSFEGRNNIAQASYDMAIKAAQSAGFVHEQGLACEQAACHYLKTGNIPTAVEFFRSAKDSYSRWGSQMKVDYITERINDIEQPSQGGM